METTTTETMTQTRSGFVAPEQRHSHRHQQQSPATALPSTPTRSRSYSFAPLPSPLSEQKRSCLSQNPASRGRRVRFVDHHYRHYPDGNDDDDDDETRHLDPDDQTSAIMVRQRQRRATPMDMLHLLGPEDMPPPRALPQLSPLNMRRHPIHLPPLGLDVDKLRAERQSKWGVTQGCQSNRIDSEGVVEEDDLEKWSHEPLEDQTGDEDEKKDGNNNIHLRGADNHQADQTDSTSDEVPDVKFKMTRSLHEIQEDLESRGEASGVRFKMSRSPARIRKSRAAIDVDSSGEDAEHTVAGASFAGLTRTSDRIKNGQSAMAGAIDPDNVSGTAEGEVSNPVNASLGMVASEASAATSSDEDLPGHFRRAVADPNIVNVTHPWGIVDYHLYLIIVDKGQGQQGRRNSKYLFDGTECRQVCYEELFDPDTFDPIFVGPEPKVLFAILPIPEADLEFRGQKYVLGMDYKTNMLFARRFKYLPPHLEDIWEVWEDGRMEFCASVPDTRKMLLTAFNFNDGRYGPGMISADNNCVERFAATDPGMELVLSIMFGQFIVDFIEPLSNDPLDQLDQSKAEVELFIDECRHLLQRASYRSWFAVREGMTRAEYRTQAARDQFVNELYTFNLDESWQNRSWRAPSFETCDRIRKKHRRYFRAERVKNVEDRFAQMFHGPNEETGGISATRNLRRMLAQTEQNLAEFAELTGSAPSTRFTTPQQQRQGQRQPRTLSDTPRTPSPRTQPAMPAIVRAIVTESRTVSNSSADIITPAVDHFDDPSLAQFLDVSLVEILANANTLLKSQLELDTPANRARFGALLRQIGIRKKAREPAVREPRADVDHHDYEHGHEQDGVDSDGEDDSVGEWQFDVDDDAATLQEEESAVRPALLPSPCLRRGSM